MQKFNGSLIRQFPSLVTGNAAAGIQVSVYEKGTTNFITLYESDNLAGAQLPNPLTTDGKGFYSFYAENGKYTLSFNSALFPDIDIQLTDFVDLLANIENLLNSSGGALVEQKLFSELVGGVFNLEKINYEPNLEPGGLPIFMFINGSFSLDFEQTSGSSITLTATDLNATDEITVVSVNGGGNAQFVTLEQFDPEAGTGGDDTAAFAAACAESFATGKPIQLLAKTYLVDSRSNALAEDQIKIKTGIFGVDGSVIKVRNRLTNPEDLGTQSLLYFLDLDNITLSNFTFDGNISDDPVEWNSSNFDEFYGCWGITFGRCTNVSLINITVKNTYRSGIATRTTENVYIRDCRTERTRGKFGDGFYLCGKDILVENCYAYDYTRIGYVIETNREQPYLSTRHQFNSCVAEFGHDSSDQYGDTERNAGFWFENYDTAACYKCTAINSGDRGFTMANAYRPADTEGAVDITVGKDEVGYCTTIYDTCEVIDTGTYGFTLNSLVPDYRGQVVIKNCRGTRQNLFIHFNEFEEDRIALTVEDTHCTSLFNLNTSFLMLRGGSASIKNCTMRFLDVTEQQYADLYSFDSGNNAAFINTFGTSCGHNLTVDNCKLFEKDYTQIPAIVKIRNVSSRARLHMLMSNTYTTQLEESYKTARFVGCTFKETGSVKADIVVYDGCTSYGTFRPFFTDDGTQMVSITNCLFDFTGSSAEQYLYLYSSADRGSQPNIVVNNCTIKKNFEVDGYGVRLNSTTEIKNITGIHNYEMNNCKFINTGGVTSNPIAFSDAGFSSEFTLYGVGNYKSDTLLIDGSPTLVSNY